jgi:GTP-binding protein
VLSKALECRLQPIVVINKIDRPDARPREVLSEVLDLFLHLGADDELADFPYLYASSREGFASDDPAVREGTIAPLMDLILEKIPGPQINRDAPLQMLVMNLDWSDYVGRIAIGRIQSGRVRKNQDVLVMKAGGRREPGRLASVHVFENLGRTEAGEVEAGDIVAVVGLENI